MALHSELEIYASCYDLVGVAGEVVFNMRRDAKKLFGERIVEACIELDLHIRAANMAQDKDPHLLKLLERLEVIELITRVCRDRGYMPVPGYAKIVERTQSIGKQCNGWRKQQGGGQQRLFHDR